MVGRLVGRADEVSALLARCAAVPPAAVLVAGEAGVGKTRLLDELAVRLDAAGTSVLRGGAVAGGGPFRPLAQALVRAAPPQLADDPALRPYAPVLARLLPAWPQASAPAGHVVDPVVVLGEAVRALLDVLSRDRHGVVLLDDLHWADRDTLVLLEYLSADPPVPFVLAARDDQRGPSELDLLGRRVGRIALDRLDDAHVASLAADHAGAPVDDDVVAFLSGMSGGLPLLVVDVLDGLLRAGDLRRSRGRWAPQGPLRTRTTGVFARLVADRVVGLPEGARRLVRTAALLGDELDWRFVDAATGGTEASDVRAAVDGGLLLAGPESLRWRHALTRDAVLDDLTPPDGDDLARRAVAHLGGETLAGAQLATAADLCVRAGDRVRAAHLLLALGREHVATGALTSAGDVLISAAALVAAGTGGPDGASVAGEIVVEHLRALGLAARTDEALALGEQTLPGLDDADAARVNLQLARACVAAERWDAAAAHLDAAGPADAPERLALAAHVALARDDPATALRLAAEAAETGPPETACEALEITGRALRRSDPPASRAAFAEGERIAAEHGLTPWRIRALAEMGTHDMLDHGGLDRLREARALAAESGQLGTTTTLDLQITAGTTSVDGHVAALPIARRCADVATRLRLPGPAAHAMMFVSRGLFWSGDTDGGAAVLEESLRTSPSPMPLVSARASRAGYDAWLNHDGAAGAAGLALAVDALRASSVSNPAPLWGHWALLSTVVDPRDAAPLEELRGSDVQVQASNRAALRYGDAVVAARAGDVERSRALVEAGDTEVRGRNHERLFLRCLMIDHDGPTAAFDAEVLLREALTRWEPAGEVRLARWCRERLRMLGLPVPRPARDRTTVPPSLRAIGVTGREWEVLRLVAAGAANADVAVRLHLSTRTVETHVSNLLAKTGAAGRAALTTWLPG